VLRDTYQFSGMAPGPICSHNKVKEACAVGIFPAVVHNDPKSRILGDNVHDPLSPMNLDVINGVNILSEEPTQRTSPNLRLVSVFPLLFGDLRCNSPIAIIHSPSLSIIMGLSGKVVPETSFLDTQLARVCVKIKLPALRTLHRVRR
jgi:hypothetical protein